MLCSDVNGISRNILIRIKLLINNCNGEEDILVTYSDNEFSDTYTIDLIIEQTNDHPLLGASQ